MNETFLLSNILPQDIDNNAGFWNRLELHCRDLTKTYEDVHVISGPLMLPNVTEKTEIRIGGQKKTIDQKFIKYPVIGQSEVAVPTHLFKVIIANERKGPSHMAAFIIPNEPITRHHKLPEYQVPLEEVERHAGFELAPSLDRSKALDLCQNNGCQLMSYEQFEMFFIHRRITSATTLNRLEKAWNELAAKDLKPDKELNDAYNKKKQELSVQQ